MIETIDKKRFYKEINGLALMVFGAPWCIDCRKIEPMLAELAKEYEDVKFFHIKIDDNEALKDKLNIRKIPTLISYKKGVEVAQRLVEPNSKSIIEDAIKKLISQGMKG